LLYLINYSYEYTVPDCLNSKQAQTIIPETHLAFWMQWIKWRVLGRRVLSSSISTPTQCGEWMTVMSISYKLWSKIAFPFSYRIQKHVRVGSFYYLKHSRKKKNVTCLHKAYIQSYKMRTWPILMQVQWMLMANTGMYLCTSSYYIFYYITWNKETDYNTEHTCQNNYKTITKYSRTSIYRFSRGWRKQTMNAGKRLIQEASFLTKKVVHCLLLLGRILPQLKIWLFKT